VIRRARRDYDIVIVDSPPILMVTDAAIAGSQVDGIILVVRVGQTKRQNAQRAIETLKELGTPILGTVINAIAFEAGQYGYGYVATASMAPAVPHRQRRVSTLRPRARTSTGSR